MYKLVVFDLDGTLADTLSDLAVSMNEALKNNNEAPHDVECYNKFVGNGIYNLVKRVLRDKGDDEVLCKKVKAFFDDYYPKHLCDNTVSYEGIPELLKELRALSIKTAVNSNKPHIFVPKILKTLFPEHSFDVAWGNKEEFERKPSPQALEAIIKMSGVSNDETLYVGDSDVDVFTAHNAGVRVCGVSWGFRGEEELREAGADYIAYDSNQLLSIIKG